MNTITYMDHLRACIELSVLHVDTVVRLYVSEFNNFSIRFDPSPVECVDGRKLKLIHSFQGGVRISD